MVCFLETPWEDVSYRIRVVLVGLGPDMNILMGQENIYKIKSKNYNVIEKKL